MMFKKQPNQQQVPEKYLDFIHPEKIMKGRTLRRLLILPFRKAQYPLLLESASTKWTIHQFKQYLEQAFSIALMIAKEERQKEAELADQKLSQEIDLAFASS